jgi:amidase
MHCRSIPRGFSLPVVILATGMLTHCNTFFNSRSPLVKLRGDREFIRYWPPKEEGKLKLAVKDVIDVKGVVTTAGSKLYAERGHTATSDAECLKGARSRGVEIVGKTNLTELALGASGLNDYFGTPRNHVDEDKRFMPGGSSSGSAVAVATGKADVAFGTDTAGSIRTPAACCGVFGLKTTYGLVPLKGVYPISPRTLDTVGPMARDTKHLAEGMDLLKPGTASAYRQEQASKPTGRSIRVGRLYIPGTDPAIDEAVDAALKRAGFQVVRLDPRLAEGWDLAKKHGRIVALADGYESDHHLLNEKGVTFTTKTAILLGKVEHNSKNYQEAMLYRPLWQRQLRQVLQNVDLIALPTLKSLPLKMPWIGRYAVFEARALEMQNTVPVNYAGNPAVAIPIPMEGKDPWVTSLQLIGPNKGEAELLNAARIVESKGR